jgi:transforming growth factor-beta-induced protein
MKRSVLFMLVAALVCSVGVKASLADCGTCDKTVVENAVASDDFKTLVAAIKAADLVETLSGEGPFTVFAPTDKAFAKLPKGTLETLLKPENKKKLAGILTYHVVAGKVMAADVVKLKNAKTVQGKNVRIRVKDGKVMLNKANVVKTDIVCKNGVIHVIDTVILPPEGKKGKKKK